MEHLTKHQLILVALLVSFVTSLATGIVTVSLMDQAPQAVTRTVNQVIERTIQQVAPQTAGVAGTSISLHDRIVDAVTTVSQSTVTLVNADSGATIGRGLIVSKKGVILTDKSLIAQVGTITALTATGQRIPVTLIQSQINGDIVFLAPVNATSTFKAAILGTVPKLGETVFSLRGQKNDALAQGLITQIPTVTDTTATTLDAIKTSIAVSETVIAGALFNADGNIIGIRTSSLSQNDLAQFYSIEQLKTVIPVL